MRLYTGLFSPSSSSSYFALKHRSMVGTVYVLSKNKIKIYKIQVKIFIFTSEKAVYGIGVFLYKICILKKKLASS